MPLFLIVNMVLMRHYKSMISDINLWFERVYSLHRSQMRKAASQEGLMPVHLEILQYLAICNRYSNTAQAICEYLGQTKGSISQTIKFLEDNEFVEKKPDSNDKRYSRLYLTKQATDALTRLQNLWSPTLPETLIDQDTLKDLLKYWQNQTHQEGFGQCISCKYNRKIGSNKFFCELTQDSLSEDDTSKLCKEHAFEQN